MLLALQVNDVTDAYCTAASASSVYVNCYGLSVI